LYNLHCRTVCGLEQHFHHPLKMSLHFRQRSSLHTASAPKHSTGLHAPQLPCCGIKSLRSAVPPRSALPEMASISQDMYRPSKLNDKSFKVLSLVASCVEINVRPPPSYLTYVTEPQTSSTLMGEEINKVTSDLCDLCRTIWLSSRRLQDARPW